MRVNILCRSVLCVYMATVSVSTCILCTKIASKLLHNDYVFTVVWAEITDSLHNMSHACAVHDTGTYASGVRVRATLIGCRVLHQKISRFVASYIHSIHLPLMYKVYVWYREN